ncbi:MAG TPA: cytochrome P450 [Bryobacteraceae bacterium]|nr:cytochrome P450 [Bryobacteraceae bacterium]
MRPPGPTPHFLIGNIPLVHRDPLSLFRSWAEEYGDIFYYRAMWVRVYFLNHPDLIEFVLVRHYQNFLKDRVIRSNRWLFGESLLTSEGETWKKRRRLAQPAFHRERIVAYAGIMTCYAEQMLTAWRDEAQIDIHQEMMRLTLAIAVRALFDVPADGVPEISRAINVLMRNMTGARMLLPSFVRLLPWPGLFEFRRAVRKLDETVYRIIRLHRESGHDAGDLLSMLIEARGEDGSRLDDRQIRDEVMTFLLAGHETTALALSWAWQLLSQNPQAEEKLREELDRVLGGRLPEISDLPSLKYAEGVIKESMRLYPPAWGVGRSVIQEFDLAGYRIPAGSNVVMSPWVMHRDPRFFADPLQFDPDRWNREDSRKLPRFAYFPFGAGPRQCIGASFAMMEAVLLLATIAQRFQLHLVGAHPVEPLPSITLRPKGEMWVRVRSRVAARASSADANAARKTS